MVCKFKTFVPGGKEGHLISKAFCHVNIFKTFGHCIVYIISTFHIVTNANLLYHVLYSAFMYIMLSICKWGLSKEDVYNLRKICCPISMSILSRLSVAFVLGLVV